MLEKTKSRIIFCSCLLALNLCFIWGNSLLPGEISGALSDFVKDILKGFLELLFGPRPDGPSGGGGLLRKLAHFTEFTCLGLCLSWLFGMLRTKPIEHILFPLFAGFTAACIDETIQIFVPLRGPAIKDVGIDTAGVVLGIVFIALFQLIKKTKSNKTNLEENKL